MGDELESISEALEGLREALFSEGVDLAQPRVRFDKRLVIFALQYATSNVDHVAEFLLPQEDEYDVEAERN